MSWMDPQYCARCGKYIRDGETTGESGLYSPKRAFTLCEKCWLEEDAEIEKNGSNDMPSVVASYAYLLDNINDD